MPTFRADLDGLVTYVPGKPIEDMARELGIHPDEVVKLASNESPDGPFPGVVEAIAAAAAGSNRYPDTELPELRSSLSADMGLDPGELWFGAGSVALLSQIAYGVGGPGTSAVYAWPSFVMYRIVSRWAMSDVVEVQLDQDLALDLESIRSAIRADTTVVYLCNPNNPTGTVVSGDAVDEFIESVPGSVLVVVDEAYHDFVSEPAYRSAVPLATSRPNVVVLRTFSKVYALAAHRVGYAIGQPETLALLQRTQAPFTVSTVAQAAVVASIGQTDEIRRRTEANAAGRHHLGGVLAERSLPHSRSEANFVYFRLDLGERSAGDEFARRGVIVRPMSGGWVRVTVGHPLENEKFVTALDQIIADA